MKRRTFIYRTATAAAAGALIPSLACGRGVPKTGLILYTVRGEMESDPEGTLDAVASIGYNWLEAADYSDGFFYNLKPAEFRRMIESRGMSLVSSHNGMNDGNYERIIGDAAEAGLMYVVVPSLPRSAFESVDSLKRTAEFLNRAGEKCLELGMKAGFHNHTIEFAPVEGVVPLDVLIENTDPGLVCFELDLAWATSGGASPVEYFNRYPGRFELWHIKDLSADKKDATLGEGIIDFSPIFDTKKISGLKYFFVEQDDCTTHTPLESIEISRNFLLNNIL
jgi:sugar phosphate isomerase/epimerase